MIVLKTAKEIEAMKVACKISAEALALAGEAVKPGVSTAEIDRIAHDFIVKAGAKPNFLNYNGFPATACISINNEVIHGIPRKNRIIEEGDIVSIDLGAVIGGFHGDNAATFAAGKIDSQAQRLCDATRESLYEAIKVCEAGGRLGDIGHAVQSYVEARGYSVVREFVGHGVGRKLHEDPNVPNFGSPGRGIRLMPGMTLAIEPMVNAGTPQVRQLKDGWTIVTADGKYSAHFEHTVAITANGPVILTKV